MYFDFSPSLKIGVFFEVLRSSDIRADFNERLMICAISSTSSCAQSLRIQLGISSVPSAFFLLSGFKCFFTSGTDTCENLKMLFTFSIFSFGVDQKNSLKGIQDLLSFELLFERNSRNHLQFAIYHLSFYHQAQILYMWFHILVY